MTAPVAFPRTRLSKRTLATGLLLSMAAIFLLTLAIDTRNFWVELLQAIAEAALVGGIADWFAVTALFRQPLGLPIPHTAIVPMSKERIGAGLAKFLGENFLSAERLALTLRTAQPAMRLGAWLNERSNARRVATQIADALLERGVATEVSARVLGGADPRRLLDFALGALEAAELDEALLDEVLRGAIAFMRKSAGRLEDRAGRRGKGLLRRTFDRQVMRAIMDGLTRLFEELGDKSNPSRAKLLSTIHAQTRAAFADDETVMRFRTRMSRLNVNPQAAASLESFFGAEESRAEVRSAIEEILIMAGERLRLDETTQSSVDTLLASLANDSSLLQEGFMKMIAEGARGYDTHDFSGRIERAVSDDLQYIRINGSVVGAMVGCLLFLLKFLVT